MEFGESDAVAAAEAAAEAEEGAAAPLLPLLLLLTTLPAGVDGARSLPLPPPPSPPPRPSIAAADRPPIAPAPVLMCCEGCTPLPLTEVTGDVLEAVCEPPVFAYPVCGPVCVVDEDWRVFGVPPPLLPLDAVDAAPDPTGGGGAVGDPVMTSVPRRSVGVSGEEWPPPPPLLLLSEVEVVFGGPWCEGGELPLLPLCCGDAYGEITLLLWAPEEGGVR